MNCDHPNPKTTMMPEGSTHYARQDCPDCGRFVKWLPHPETIAKREENKRRVKVLQGMPQNEWMKGFLASFPDKPSPKQQAKLDEKWKEQSR